MSETCDRKEFWRLVMNDCLKICDMIDWERSHPDLIQDITSALGIDVARNHFLSVSSLNLISSGFVSRFMELIGSVCLFQKRQCRIFLIIESNLDNLLDGFILLLLFMIFICI